VNRLLAGRQLQIECRNPKNGHSFQMGIAFGHYASINEGFPLEQYWLLLATVLCRFSSTFSAVLHQEIIKQNS
jgi:hypothetical protein